MPSSKKFSIGRSLHGLASKTRKRFYASNIANYHLKLKDISLTYTTEDEYSKSWFFPRYEGGRYHEPATTNLFINKIKPNDCVLDIGAHLGFFTCLAAKLARNGVVHAFEVDENCMPIVK